MIWRSEHGRSDIVSPLERQQNGWWLVRFPGVPEALTEGETEKAARANALDCVIAALEGYMKAGKPLPWQGAGHSGSDRAVLPSLATAKLAVYETMRTRSWSNAKLAGELGMSDASAGCSICITVRTCGSSMTLWRR